MVEVINAGSSNALPTVLDKTANRPTDGSLAVKEARNQERTAFDRLIGKDDERKIAQGRFVDTNTQKVEQEIAGTRQRLKDADANISERLKNTTDEGEKSALLANREKIRTALDNDDLAQRTSERVQSQTQDRINSRRQIDVQDREATTQETNTAVERDQVRLDQRNNDSFARAEVEEFQQVVSNQISEAEIRQEQLRADNAAENNRQQSQEEITRRQAQAAARQQANTAYGAAGAEQPNDRVALFDQNA